MQYYLTILSINYICSLSVTLQMTHSDRLLLHGNQIYSKCRQIYSKCICGRIASLSQWVAQIAQMAEYWYGFLEDLDLIPGLGL